MADDPLVTLQVGLRRRLLAVDAARPGSNDCFCHGGGYRSGQPSRHILRRIGRLYARSCRVD